MESRIFIKNFPVSTTEVELYNIFLKLGNVTDVKIMRTKNGISRQFGFIGFSTFNIAKKAIEEFDGTFIGTHKISLQMAKKENFLFSNNNLDDDFHKCNIKNKKITSKIGFYMNKEKQKVYNKEKTYKIDNVKSVRTIFIRNLSCNTTDSDLNGLFSKFGDIEHIKILNDAANKFTVIAFVQFSNSKSASEAQKNFHRNAFQGRILTIKRANKNLYEIYTNDKDSYGTKTYKENKLTNLKENIGNRKSWNTFYLKPETVGNSISKTFGLSKNNFLHPEESDLGVKMALGELYMLNKTKENLSKSGVNIAALEHACGSCGKNEKKAFIARSKTAILIKNLPSDAVDSDLKVKFGKYGNIMNFILPPSKTIALVDYQSENDARRAFINLAYSKYKNVPLFLEWAPKDFFTKNNESLVFTNISREQNSNDTCSINKSIKTIYIKNISFLTKEEALKRHFDSIASEIGGSIKKASIIYKRHRNGYFLSAGYGFIEFDDSSTTNYVMQKMQHTYLDGHRLKLSLSNELKYQPKNKVNSRNKHVDNKLLVKNIAFEGSRDEIIKLFSTYGNIKSCRLPKKVDGHRGFAFIEYYTKHEADKAIKDLSYIHFYGRRLNIEFAHE